MKNIIKAFTLLGCVLVVACQNQFEAPISEEKLIAVLADIHTAEAVTQTENQNMRDSATGIYYTQIFEHHGVTHKDFDSTMAVYARYPVQFDSVYSRVSRLVKSQKDTLHETGRVK
jgi:hypothetical protein